MPIVYPPVPPILTTPLSTAPATLAGVKALMSSYYPHSAYASKFVGFEDIVNIPYLDGFDKNGNRLWAVGAGDNGILDYIEDKYNIKYLGVGPDGKHMWSGPVTNLQVVQALYKNLGEAQAWADNEFQIHSSIDSDVASKIKALAMDLYLNWGSNKVKKSNFAKDIKAGNINEALVNAAEVVHVAFDASVHVNKDGSLVKGYRYIDPVHNKSKLIVNGLEIRRDALIKDVYDARRKSGEQSFVMTTDEIRSAVNLKRAVENDGDSKTNMTIEESVQQMKNNRKKQGIPTSTNEQEANNSINNSIQNSSVQGDFLALSQTATVDTNTDGKTPVTPTRYTPTELASLVNAGVLGSNPSYNVVFKNAKQVGLSMDISSDNYNIANQATTISVIPVNVSNAATTTGTSYIFANALAGTKNPHVNVDPLVLDLDGDGIDLLLFGEKETYFDTDNDGYKERTGWVGKDDGILVHDHKGVGTSGPDGKITDITETISEYYKAPAGGGTLGGPASNPFKSGFDALKTLDSNGDGVINSADSVWSELRIWQDINGDGISHSTGLNPVSELKTLASLGITEIKLTNKADGSFINGNEVRADGTATNGGGFVINGQVQTVSSVNFLSNTFGLVEVANPSGSSLAGKSYKVQRDSNTTYTTYAADNGGESVDLTSATYSTYNNIIGGTGDDTLKGNSQDNWLVGNTGKDTMDAGDGDDYVVADAADITSDQSGLKGGSGYDTIQFVDRIEREWSRKPYHQPCAEANLPPPTALRPVYGWLEVAA